jgi:hypothetical protein
LPAENNPEPVILSKGPFQFIQICNDLRTGVSIDQSSMFPIDIIVANWGGEIIVALTRFYERCLRKHFRYRDAIPGSKIFCDKS